MSNKRNLSSQQSNDTVIKLNLKLRNDLLEQLESFVSAENEDLLIELKKLLEFRCKRRKYETEDKKSIAYLEISICQIEKIVDILCKLDGHSRLKNQSNDLLFKINNIKKEIIDDLIMLPSKLFLEFEINEDNNLNNYNEPNFNDKIITNDKIIENLFQHLSIKDLLNCRLVNKQFKYFSDHTDGINKLVIGQQYYVNYWYYNNQLINDNEIIRLECFRSIKLLSIFNLDKNLKYLKICDNQLKLEEISNFINLESLEFDLNFNYGDEQIINLNNLKVLVLDDLNVKLNTPKLEKIQFYNSNQIQFDSNPQSIKHLITYNYDNKFEKFENLEIIELTYNDQSINKNLLIIFKKLNKFKLNLNSYGIDYSNEQLKNSLIKILNDKIKLRRETDIYLEDVKIENIDKLNELIANEFSVWKLRINNYDQLDSNLSSIEYLDYKELEKCFKNIKTDLPASFFHKFQYIYGVYVKDVDDVDGLSWFLNNLQNLTTFIGNSLSFDNVFYNNLPNSIKYLSIYSKSDINLDFILKLSKLIVFDSRIDKDLFDLAFTSFKNLKYLKKFNFFYDKKLIKIEKKGRKGKIR